MNKQMNTGKTSSAIGDRRDPQKSETVEQTLFKKHPPPEPIDHNCFIHVSNETTLFHQSILDKKNVHRIKKATKRTQIPSGFNANKFERI